MNRGSKGLPIQVFRANHNPCMGWALLMEPDKVSTILGDDGSLIGRSKAQHLIIWDFLIGLSCVLSRQNVIAKLPQTLNYRKRKLLIGIQTNHP